MIEAMITCPTTGRPVKTGFTFGSLAAFDATTLENNRLHCPACGGDHIVDDSTVKVFPKEP